MSRISHSTSDFTMSITAPERTSSPSLIVARNQSRIDDLETDGELDGRALWDLAHEVVQDALAGLTGWFVRECPAYPWKAGRTSARAFPLFSYRVFYRRTDDEDPVVVGVTFTETGAGVRVTGDISGEASGTIYFDEECDHEVPHTARAVVQQASRTACRLAAQGAVLVQALRQRPAEA